MRTPYALLFQQALAIFGAVHHIKHQKYEEK